MEKQSLYEWLCANDLVYWVKDMVQQLGWTWRYDDGKLFCQIRPGINETPWYHVKHDHRLKCARDHQILFGIVFPKLKQSWVPSHCQQCFKVVVRPKTLKQLFALLELEKRMDFPSKCGIEIRKSTHSNYGGYFYNVGLAQGLECYKRVREEVNNDKYLGPDVEVLLKRACTEYEHACGDSDTWEITDYQLHVEDMVKRFIVLEDIEIRQPEKLLHHVQRQWIEFAFERNDPTYAEFTGDKPLYPKYKTYHHLLDDYEKGEELKIEGVYDAAEDNKAKKPRRKKTEIAVSKRQKKSEKAVTK